MGFFSFGKKKKSEASSAPPPLAKSSRPSGLTNNVSATSSLSATSSGSSAGSPVQNTRSQTHPARLGKQRHSLSFAADLPTSSSIANKEVPPIPPVPISSTAASSSSSLNAPGGHPYVNRNLAKKGSTNSFTSTKSASRRGPHDPPPLADCLAKPRSASYHAPQVRNIWVTSASTDGHTMVSTPAAASLYGSKYHSTGSPFMSRGSYYGDTNTYSQGASDEEFKKYTKLYEAAITKAHSLAREYHHSPPAKRDRSRFEEVGKNFAAAARISREHWSYRCQLEKERLNGLMSGGRLSQADIYAQDQSPHRIAGMRATEGWQYASMLADAWGSNEEMSTPLEEMAMLKPNYPTWDPYGTPSSYNDYSPSGGYLHPGYMQGGYSSYMTQPAESAPELATRDRLDSIASRHTTDTHSTHTHSTVSHAFPPSSQKDIPPVPPLPSGLLTSSSVVQETASVSPKGPIKLTKGRRYRSSTIPTAVAAS